MKNYYNKLKTGFWKQLFLLMAIRMLLINYSFGANPGSPVLTNSSVANASEKTTEQVNNISSTTYSSQCTEPGANAIVSGSITCVNPSVTLIGSSPTSGVTYSWSGPNGFTSVFQSLIVDSPGKYILTVTSNSCISKDSVNVLMDTEPPANVEASVSGVLNFNNPTVILSGTSLNPNAQFFWTGPNGFSSTDAITSAYMPGTYILIATDPFNGCYRTVMVDVLSVLEKSYPLTSREDVKKDVQISAYPNPFTDNAFIEFTPKKSVPVTITLHSINGTLQRVLFKGKVEALQPYKFAFEGTGLEAGPYYIVVATVDKKVVASNKIICIKK